MSSILFTETMYVKLKWKYIWNIPLKIYPSSINPSDPLKRDNRNCVTSFKYVYNLSIYMWFPFPLLFSSFSFRYIFMTSHMTLSSESCMYHLNKIYKIYPPKFMHQVLILQIIWIHPNYLGKVLHPNTSISCPLLKFLISQFYRLYISKLFFSFI